MLPLEEGHHQKCCNYIYTECLYWIHLLLIPNQAVNVQCRPIIVRKSLHDFFHTPLENGKEIELVTLIVSNKLIVSSHHMFYWQIK